MQFKRMSQSKLEWKFVLKRAQHIRTERFAPPLYREQHRYTLSSKIDTDNKYTRSAILHKLLLQYVAFIFYMLKNVRQNFVNLKNNLSVLPFGWIVERLFHFIHRCCFTYLLLAVIMMRWILELSTEKMKQQQHRLHGLSVLL